MKGQLPSSWQQVSLGEIVDNQDGKRVPLKRSEREKRKGSYPYYGASGIIDHVDDYLFDGDFLLVAEDGANLLARSTPIAFPASGRFWVNNHAHVLASNGKADLRFLQRYLCHINVKRYVTGSAQPKLNRKNLDRIEVPLPPIEEQVRLADLLDQAEKIRLMRVQSIKIADDIMRSAYLEFFGDPVSNSKDWPKKQLDSVADIVTGFAFKSAKYVEHGVRLCRGANVLPDKIEWSDVRYWCHDDTSVNQKLHLEIGDVVLAMDRPWISAGLKVAQVTENDIPAFLVQRVTRLRGVGDISNSFIYHTIRHPAFTAHCGALKTETTVPHISATDIKSFRVPIAPAETHKAFEDLALHVQATVQKLTEAANVANSFFNSLVQSAFKGEL